MSAQELLWRITGGAKLQGCARAPGSKSQSLRALLFASLASSSSRIDELLDSADTDAMKKIALRMGARLEWLEGAGEALEFGRSVHMTPIHHLDSEDTWLLDACNSGIVWRFCTAIASLRPAMTLLSGDRSILFRRPMQPLIAALRQVGVHIWRTHPQGGPLVVRGPWKCEKNASVRMNGFDSQPVSAMLIASALQHSASSVDLHVDEAREIPWAMLTVKWLREFGVDVESYSQGHAKFGSFYRVMPKKWAGRDYRVPSDFSSAAFLIAAALVTGSNLELEGLMKEDPQPDRLLIEWLQQAGAAISWQGGRLIVDGSVCYRGFEVDLTGPIDLVPIVAVLACYATTPSWLKGIAGAKIKESDRVAAIVQELTKMGACIEASEDALRIFPNIPSRRSQGANLHGAKLDSHRDHRLAMALAVAALGAEGESLIAQAQWANKTFPSFAKQLIRLGASMKVETR